MVTLLKFPAGLLVMQLSEFCRILMWIELEFWPCNRDCGLGPKYVTTNLARGIVLSERRIEFTGA